MAASIQQQLFVMPESERKLGDAARTVLEVIDKKGQITVTEAGRIVFRLRGYRTCLAVPKDWLISAGVKVLRQLQRRGFVKRTRANRWVRVPC